MHNVTCVWCRLQYGLTPLMMATMKGKMEAANVLLEAGADVNLQSYDVRYMYSSYSTVYIIIILVARYMDWVNALLR